MVRIHPLPAGEAASGDFSAVIGGERATPWLCRVSAMPYNTVWPGHQRPLEQTEPASFLSFEMQEPVEVRLTANREIVLENVSFNGRRLLPEQIRLEKSPFDEVALK